VSALNASQASINLHANIAQRSIVHSLDYLFRWVACSDSNLVRCSLRIVAAAPVLLIATGKECFDASGDPTITGDRSNQCRSHGSGVQAVARSVNRKTRPRPTDPNTSRGRCEVERESNRSHSQKSRNSILQFPSNGWRGSRMKSRLKNLTHDKYEARYAVAVADLKRAMFLVGEPKTTKDGRFLRVGDDLCDDEMVFRFAYGAATARDIISRRRLRS